jgi:CheY-like chemotaxis protein
MQSKETIPRILYVEDRPEFARQVGEKLRTIPAEVEVASCGDEMVDRLLSDTRYDLVVLDVKVPRSRGRAEDIDFGVSFLVEHQGYYQLIPPSIPIIVFTSYPSYPDCVSCVRSGARDYIPRTDPVSHQSNLSVLADRCSQLLKADPIQDTEFGWLREYQGRLQETIGAPYIAAIPNPKAVEAGITGAVIGGRTLIESESIGDIKRILLSNPVLRWERPRIFKVAKV